MAAIRSEGGLLPADVLTRIAAADHDLGGLAIADFHLAPNERLGEAIARSWARLTAAWDAFSTDRDGLPAGDHAGRPTRERWLLPLFSELGYGRLIQQPGVEIEGKTYSVFCEYNHSPVHLVGAGVPLDRRTAGVRGAADQSPHSVVQDLLNRSPERLWGIVTNGLTLRLLRDNVTLTRQAYVEFDLEAIFATEAYEDFALLWLCAHQSRFEAETPEECWLEVWTQAAQRDGTRALGELRSGVERAIEALGRGFLAQPTNSTLHAALRDGGLDGPAYYRELLRLIYRLLFLFVAEDRDALLLPDDGSAERFDARERYVSFYATKRLRRLSVRRRGGRAHDLYEQVKLLSGWLYDGGQPVLALPPLGSALWSPDTTAHVSDARLGNEALLEAIRELAYVEGGRRPVDFRNLGAEELGSVYESLLELHPEIDRTTGSFVLITAAGHDRKQTGSYYTPSTLIAALLDSALDPILDEAARAEEPEKALLNITVCDPACGSGHFLIAAANRIGKHLAATRERDPEPAPEAVRRALRDVIGRCLFGIDVNPMSVELCKVSLWLEALDPGRPLSFLDAHIVVGNSLLGATPNLIEAGVPDEAFKAIFGDDKPVISVLRKRNRAERSGQASLDLFDTPSDSSRRLAEAGAAMEQIPDDSIKGVEERERRFHALVESPDRVHAQLIADTWCAAIIAPKRKGEQALTHATVDRIVRDGAAALSTEEREIVATLADRHRFLHLHTTFPWLFGSGGRGFRVVLGNPPWERVKLQEKEFFAARHPGIAAARNKADRGRLINQLAIEDPDLLRDFEDAKRGSEAEAHLIRASGRFPLCGHGDLNTFALFAEVCGQLSDAVCGLILPTGVVTDDQTSGLIRRLLERGELRLVADADNSSRLFPAVHPQTRFCLFVTGPPRDGAGDSHTEMSFGARSAGELADASRRYSLSTNDIRTMSPNTRTLPIIESKTDAEFVLGIHRRSAVLVEEGVRDGNPWQLTFATMFHMANDSGLFSDVEIDGSVPLYEARMMHQFDARWATYENGTARRLTDEELRDPTFEPCPRYWVPRPELMRRFGEVSQRPWVMGYRGIKNNENERTLLFTAGPPVAYGHNFSLVLSEHESAWLLLPILNSLIVDFVVRRKTPGNFLPYFAFKQLPIPRPEAAAPMAGYFRERVVELVYTHGRMAAFADSLGYHGAPFAWDEERRRRARLELDAAVFELYGIDSADVHHVMESFRVLKEREIARFGTFASQQSIVQLLSTRPWASR